MNTCIALLRAVNVGGHNMIAMPALRAFLEELGFEDVRTLLQSGNVVLRAKKQPAAKLETLIETEAAKRIGLTTTFFIRAAAEWADLMAANPFAAESKGDPGHMAVIFAKDVLLQSRVEELRRSIRGREVVQAAGKQLYAVYPDGFGRSKLTTAVIEKILGTKVTARNWNTVVKLANAAQVST